LHLNKRYTTRTLAFSLSALFALVFVGLALVVKTNRTLSIDRPILLFIHRHASTFWDSFFTLVTQFGDKFFVAGFTAVMIGYFIVRRQKFRAKFTAVAVLGSALLNLLLKHLFERHRPELWHRLVDETSFSFPSGHAMASSGLAFALIYLTWGTRWRILGCTISLVYMLVIGISRLYLGVHYPTDVLGGWVASVAWVLLCVGLLASRSSKHNQ
jgi:membrane-associated phospholipid phosphatase